MFEPIKELFNILNSQRSLLLRVFIVLTLISLIYISYTGPIIYFKCQNFYQFKRLFNDYKSVFFRWNFRNQSDGARDVQILSEIIIGNSFFNQLVKNNTIISSNDDNEYSFES